MKSVSQLTILRGRYGTEHSRATDTSGADAACGDGGRDAAAVVKNVSGRPRIPAGDLNLRLRPTRFAAGRMGSHRGVLPQAEGWWTFHARDRMPRSSRLTAHPRRRAPPPARAGAGPSVEPTSTDLRFGSFPAVPARQRRGRLTSISGPPNSSALTWRSVTRRPDDNVLDLLS